MKPKRKPPPTQEQLTCEWCGKVMKRRAAVPKHKMFCKKRPDNTPTHKETVLARRQRVYELRMRGFPVNTIAGTVGVSHNTVISDLDAIQDNVIEHLKNTPKSKLIVQELMKADHFEDQMKFQYYSTNDTEPGVKLGYAKAFMEMWRNKVDKMMNLGLLPKQAEQIELEVTGLNLSSMTMQQLDELYHKELKEYMELRSQHERERDSAKS